MNKKINTIITLILTLLLLATGLKSVISKDDKPDDKDNLISQVHKEDTLLDVSQDEITLILDDLDKNITSYFAQFESLMKPIINMDEILSKENDDYDGYTAMENIILSNQNIDFIYYADQYGNMFVRPDLSLPEEFDPQDRSWYKNALTKTDIVWSPPFIDAFTGQQVITASLQVFDKGELNGVLGMDLKIDPNIYLSTYDLIIPYEVVILAEDGLIIYDKSSGTLGFDYYNDEVLQNIKKGLTIFKYMTDETNSDMEKEERFAFTRKNSLGWTIVITIRSDDIEQE